ncbi:MAG: serine/threonine protein kinase [Thermoanaerobaculia bacterium]|nr:serine/threonine protein kinase [Thermoanaerobaculia bacterium]
MAKEENAMTRFEPRPLQEIKLLQEEYLVEPHPKSKWMPYSAEAGRAVVYKLKSIRSGVFYALKVFKNRFRDSEVVGGAERLIKFSSIPGMKAAERRVVLPDEPLARQFADLQFAVIMPWIEGRTWFDILESTKTGHKFSRDGAAHLCERFLGTVRQLESRRLAHTDLSPGNIMFDLARFSVELLDLEDMYSPDFPAPRHIESVRGSKGYRNVDAINNHHLWRPEADRFSAAIISAEILMMTESHLVMEMTGDGFFSETENRLRLSDRFESAKTLLDDFSPSFSAAFQQAWFAQSLEACPTVDTLYGCIADIARQQNSSPSSILVSFEHKTVREHSNSTPPGTGPIVDWAPLPTVTWEQPSASHPSPAHTSSNQPAVASSQKTSRTKVSGTGKQKRPRNRDYWIAAFIAFVLAIATNTPGLLWIIPILFVIWLLTHE